MTELGFHLILTKKNFVMNFISFDQCMYDFNFLVCIVMEILTGMKGISVSYLILSKIITKNNVMKVLY